MGTEGKDYKEAVEKVLARLQQDPQFELKVEFGKLLMRHINSFSQEEMKRYDELRKILMLAEN